MTRSLSLAEFGCLAEHVTDINAATLINASRVDLADSALHAPQAGFGDTEFYPDLCYEAAVLASQGVMTTLPTAVRSISERSASPACSSG